MSRQYAIDLLKEKAQKCRELALRAKRNENLAEANECFARSEAYHESARIVENTVRDDH